mmetsp:Transcript_14127/g.41008  ORF Transcript_14127/g.41008 Transcript_14127/m.41008 type:complete len:273 (+) Transcript_14127:2858-3676(+)
MVNAVRLLLSQVLCKAFAELTAALAVLSKRFLDNHTGPPSFARTEVCCSGRCLNENIWRNRQEEHAIGPFFARCCLLLRHGLIQRLEPSALIIWPRLIEATSEEELLSGCTFRSGIYAACQRHTNKIAEFFVRHLTARVAKHLEVLWQQALIVQSKDCRKDFLLGQVTRCAHDDDTQRADIPGVLLHIHLLSRRHRVRAVLRPHSVRQRDHVVGRSAHGTLPATHGSALPGCRTRCAVSWRHGHRHSRHQRRHGMFAAATRSMVRCALKYHG